MEGQGDAATRGDARPDAAEGDGAEGGAGADGGHGQHVVQAVADCAVRVVDGRLDRRMPQDQAEAEQDEATQRDPEPRPAHRAG